MRQCKLGTCVHEVAEELPSSGDLKEGEALLLGHAVQGCTGGHAASNSLHTMNPCHCHIICHPAKVKCLPVECEVCSLAGLSKRTPTGTLVQPRVLHLCNYSRALYMQCPRPPHLFATCWHHVLHQIYVVVKTVKANHNMLQALPCCEVHNMGDGPEPPADGTQALCSSNCHVPVVTATNVSIMQAVRALMFACSCPSYLRVQVMHSTQPIDPMTTVIA